MEIKKVSPKHVSSEGTKIKLEAKKLVETNYVYLHAIYFMRDLKSHLSAIITI